MTQPIQGKGRQRLGRAGEDFAVHLLQEQGYVIRERNVRCTLGELDIVAEHAGCVVFVEVRSRSRLDYGRPEESVGWAKQQRLRRLAQWYLQWRGLHDRDCRFDVIGVVPQPDGTFSGQLIPNAF